MLIHVSLHPVALKGVVPTNYPATIEPYGLRRPKRTNALMANCCTGGQRPSCRRAAECDQQFPPSDGDRHTPLPCEVRKRNDTTPRWCSLHVQGGRMLVKRPTKT